VSVASDDDLLARVYSMSEDDDPEIERLRGIRAAFREMPDEDPPERGLAELMAAARVKAGEMKPVPWWQRLAAVLRRPPVLALASVMVLIGGAVLIGRRGDEEVARPTVATESPPAAATGGAAPAGSASAGDDERVRDEKRDTALMTPDEPALRPELAKPAKAAHDAPKPANSPPADPTPARVQHSARPPVLTTPPPPPPPPPPATTDKGKEPSADRSVARSPEPKLSKDQDVHKEEWAVQGQSETAAPPPAQNVEPGAVDGRRGEGSARRATPEQMLEQCRTAAGRGDCVAAKAIAARIAKDNAAFYRERVAKDAGIARCLAK
jgi:hypothetical protein